MPSSSLRHDSFAVLSPAGTNSVSALASARAEYAASILNQLDDAVRRNLCRDSVLQEGGLEWRLFEDCCSLGLDSDMVDMASLTVVHWATSTRRWYESSNDDW